MSCLPIYSICGLWGRLCCEICKEKMSREGKKTTTKQQPLSPFSQCVEAVRLSPSQYPLLLHWKNPDLNSDLEFFRLVLVFTNLRLHLACSVFLGYSISVLICITSLSAKHPLINVSWFDTFCQIAATVYHQKNNGKIEKKRNSEIVLNIGLREVI